MYITNISAKDYAKVFLYVET